MWEATLGVVKQSLAGHFNALRRRLLLTNGCSVARGLGAFTLPWQTESQPPSFCKFMAAVGRFRDSVRPPFPPIMSKAESRLLGTCLSFPGKKQEVGKERLTKSRCWEETGEAQGD